MANQRHHSRHGQPGSKGQDVPGRADHQVGHSLLCLPRMAQAAVTSLIPMPPLSAVHAGSRWSMGFCGQTSRRQHQTTPGLLGRKARGGSAPRHGYPSPCSQWLTSCIRAQVVGAWEATDCSTQGDWRCAVPRQHHQRPALCLQVLCQISTLCSAKKTCLYFGKMGRTGQTGGMRCADGARAIHTPQH